MLEERIAAYLRSKMPEAGELTITGLNRIPGGASRETWSFDARWREGGREVQRGFVIRRDPEASVLETERDIEFQVYRALADTSIPVPSVYWLEKENEWLDRPFFVMERIDGCETSPQVLITEQYAPGRARIADHATKILAEIHNLDWKALGLGFLGVPSGPDDCGPREVAKWEETLHKDALEPQPVLEAALHWLRRHPPPPAQKIALVHSDYRTGNFLYSADSIRGWLDWELVHLGDPMEDVGWFCIRPWRWARDERVGALLERREFFRLYEKYSGLRVDEQAVRFWEVLGNVKLAVIFITGGRSFCDGRTKNIFIGFLGRNLAALEEEIMDLIGR